MLKVENSRVSWRACSCPTDSYLDYDPADVREITGILESVTWTNPHTTLVFAVENDQGELETWRAEGGAVNTMTRIGVSRDSLVIGAPITVIGPVSRFGRSEMIAARAISSGNQYEIFPALSNALDQELSSTS